MESLMQDLRYGFRRLWKSPGFTAVAVLTLALGLGANTAIFSVVYTALLRPLSFSQPDQLMQVLRKFRGGRSEAVSEPKFVYWQAHCRAFEALTAYEFGGLGFNLTGTERPERVLGYRVTKDFFRTFDVQLALGRGFLTEEDQPGARRVVVLSHSLWWRRFGGDPSILGRQITLDGAGYTVVGVMPASFRYPPMADLWTPLQPDPASHDTNNYLGVIGRLKSGTARTEAEAAMNVFLEQHRQISPEDVWEQEAVTLMPLQEWLYGGFRPALLTLLGAVGLVLLIACVNVANLQLARAATRRKEVAIRAALGASAARIVRQLLTESVLLWLAGGAAGLMLGAWLLPLLLAFSPAGLSGVNPVVIDHTVLVFALALSLLTGLLFGLVPAVQAARSDQHGWLKEGSTRMTGPSSQTARRVLVVSEIALAAILLVGAALLVKSFARLLSTDPGFDPNSVLTMKLWLPERKYGDAGALERFSRTALDCIRSLPGVASAAVSIKLPLERGLDTSFTIEGRYKGQGMNDPGAGSLYYRPISYGYFEVLRIPLVRGRLFSDRDGAGTPGVAIINQAAARKYWPNQDPVGQRITIGPPLLPEYADAVPREIVGVVADVREVGLAQDPPGIVYVPMTQMPPKQTRSLVRAGAVKMTIKLATDPGRITAAVEQAMWAIDPELPITDVLPMDVIVARSAPSLRFSMLILSVLGGVALLLATVGTYGVLSYLVAERTPEIGICIALGAQPHDVLGMVLREGMRLIAAGLALGMAGGLVLTRVLGGFLFGIRPTDPTTYLAVLLLLGAAGLLATYIPARRATKVDPMVALRYE